jgi:DNA-binding transcriptional LysR family regulator
MMRHIMHLDLPGLEAFLAVTDLGSFGRAAQRLGLSQPALTRRVQRLEAIIGAPLLERSGRPVQLTPAGAALLPEAREALARLGEAMRQAGARRAVRDLVIGCLPTLAVRYLGPVLASHHRCWAGAVVVHDSSATEIRQLLVENRLDFALAAIGSERRELEVTPLREEPFFLVCPRGYHLAGRDSVAWAELAQAPLISIGPLSENRRIIDAAFRRAQVNARWQTEVRHLGSAVALVAAGAGVTMLPDSAIFGEATKSLARIPLVQPTVTRTIGLLQRRDRILTPAARDLMETLRAAVVATQSEPRPAPD